MHDGLHAKRNIGADLCVAIIRCFEEDGPNFMNTVISRVGGLMDKLLNGCF